MADYNLAKLQKKLKKELDAARFQHTLGVMYTAASLAMCYGQDVEKALIAGLLHDCAKCIPNDKKVKLCEKYGLPMTNIEKQAPFLLHAKLGAYLADKLYGVDDPEILGAIEWHTTGRPGMTMLEKIVYLADYIEPNRWKAQNLPEIRAMAFRDIDMAVYMTLRDTLAYLQSGSGEVDTMTQEAFVFYDTVMKNRKDKK